MKTSRPVRTVSLLQLRRILGRVKSAQPLAFTAVTKCDAYAAAPWTVYKAQRVQAFTGARFEAAVNRKLEKAGIDRHYEAGERAWGEKVAAALVRKGDEWYLPVHVLSRGRPVYLTSTATDLTVVTPDVVAPYLPIRKPRLVYGAPTVERRDYSLRSLVFVSVMGHRYRVRARS